MMALDEMEPHIPARITLLSLPAELLHEIIARATPSDSLCLALGVCSLTLYQIHFSAHGPVSLFAGSQWKRPSRVHNARRRASRRGNPLPPSNDNRFGENMKPMREYGRGWGRELHDRLEEWLRVRELRVVMSGAGEGMKERGVLVSEEEWARREEVYFRKISPDRELELVEKGPESADSALRTVLRRSQVQQASQTGRRHSRRWWARYTS